MDNEIAYFLKDVEHLSTTFVKELPLNINIDVFVLLGLHSLKFLEILKPTFELLSCGKYTYKWKCITTTQCPEVPDGFEHVCHINTRTGRDMNTRTGRNRKTGKNTMTSRPAIVHCDALNTFRSVCTSDFALLMHVDLVILKQRWDDLLMKKFDDLSVGAIGAKSVIEPSVIMTLMRKQVFVSTDFSENEDKTHNLTEKEAEILCPMLKIPIKSGMTKLFGGWRLPVTLSDLGFRTLCFDNHEIQELHYRNKRSYMGQLYIFDNEILASHFGKSINIKNDDDMTLWIKTVRSFLN